MKMIVLGLMICIASVNVFASGEIVDELRPAAEIMLPEVQTDGGKPLMRALRERRTSRSFSEKKLPLRVLSELLWAAFGINRSDSGKRTAPSARDMREIEIYAAMETGLYLYDPENHILKLVLNEDIRGITGKQDFAATAPVNLIFVADHTRMGNAGDMKDFYAAIDTGYISQNVYLYCASEDLATVARGWVDKEALAEAMELGSGKSIVLTQSVGYEK